MGAFDLQKSIKPYRPGRENETEATPVSTIGTTGRNARLYLFRRFGGRLSPENGAPNWTFTGKYMEAFSPNTFRR